MNRSFWCGKNVFITGHTGFKGSWLVQLLNYLGAKVTGYALPAPTNPSLFEQANLSVLVEHIEGDIRDASSLLTALQQSKAEVVFHLAAQPLVSEGYSDPVGTFSTNVMGTQHLLEAMRKVQSVKAAVLVSSDKCYQNQEQIWGYKETDPLGGNDPYSASKGCMELLINSYRYSFFDGEGSLNLASVRAGNVIGGGDWACNRLIPDILKALSSNETIQLRSPNATRPWQHVLEPLNGYIMLAEQLLNSAHGDNFIGSWNFGPDVHSVKNVLDLTKKLKSISCSNSHIEYKKEAEFKEAMLLNVDSTKAIHHLRWQPVWSLEQTLERTWNWQHALGNGLAAQELCKKDILSYLSDFERTC